MAASVTQLGDVLGSPMAASLERPDRALWRHEPHRNGDGSWVVSAYPGEMKIHRYYVYILTNRSRTLYIGVTNNLARRLAEHRAAGPESFTGRYRIDALVYVEEHRYILNAIAREKQLKRWTRERKIALIGSQNPRWRDLARENGVRDPSGPEGPSG